MEAIACSIKYK